MIGKKAEAKVTHIPLWVIYLFKFSRRLEEENETYKCGRFN